MIDVSALIGIPYRENGRDPATGVDCVGLCLLFLRQCLGLDVPDPCPIYEGAKTVSIDDLERNAKNWMEAKQPYQSGDVFLMAIHGDLIDHTAVYVGNRQVLHTHKSSGTVIRPMSWQSERIRKVLRYAYDPHC